MQKDQVADELHREPFAPLRIQLTDGRAFDVPFKDVAHMLDYGVLVLIGLKQGTHQAKGYERFSFEQIERIDRKPIARSRKKAS